MRRVLLALGVCLLTGCDRTAGGREAYAAGRFEAALAQFDAEVEAAGEDASPELLYDQALAALAVNEPARAEAAARRAAAGAQADVRALCDFVRGNAAYARSVLAEGEAKKPGADARAYQWAIAATEDALAAWRTAAASRLQWPAAQRNVERALLRLDRLRERKKTGSKGDTKPGDDAKPPPKPPKPKPPPPPPPPDDKGRDPNSAIERRALPPDRVLGLLELLREKAKAKQATRRAARGARAGQVERDW